MAVDTIQAAPLIVQSSVMLKANKYDPYKIYLYPAVNLDKKIADFIEEYKYTPDRGTIEFWIGEKLPPDEELIDVNEALELFENYHIGYQIQSIVQEQGKLISTNPNLVLDNFIDKLSELKNTKALKITNYILPRLQVDVMNNINEYDWLIPGYVAKGHISIMAAKSKSGKSTLIHSIIREINYNNTLFGFAAPNDLIVWYLTEESSKSISVLVDNVGAIDKGLYYYQPYDLLGTWEEKLDYVYGAYNVAEVKPNLIVIDTLASWSGLQDYNDYGKVANMMQGVVNLRDRLEENVAILLVHHANKNNENTINGILGSTAFGAMIDVGILIDNVNDEYEYITVKLRGRISGEVPDVVVTKNPLTGYMEIADVDLDDVVTTKKSKKNHLLEEILIYLESNGSKSIYELEEYYKGKFSKPAIYTYLSNNSQINKSKNGKKIMYSVAY